MGDYLSEPGAGIGAYAALKAAGHSPAKAAEIVLDARRGDKYARDWIARATPPAEPRKGEK